MCETNPNQTPQELIISIFEKIKNAEKPGGSNDQNGYSHDKEIIKEAFNKTKDININNISARLHLIDGMYSTQMDKRYYAIDELATMIFEIQNNLDDNKSLADVFKDLAKEPSREKLEPFNIGDVNLWSAHYGIGKDGEEKGIAISLISKYAYFETGYNFPIYDTIACEVMPLLKAMILDNVQEGTRLKNALKRQDNRIIRFVEEINALKEIIEESVQMEISYDHLDQLMWFVGKMLRGNFSLILSKGKYQALIKEAYIRGGCQNPANEKCPHTARCQQNCENLEGENNRADACRKHREKILEGIVENFTTEEFINAIYNNTQNSSQELVPCLYKLARRCLEVNI